MVAYERSEPNHSQATDIFKSISQEVGQVSFQEEDDLLNFRMK